MAERALPGQVAGGLRALSTEIDRLDQAAADRYGLNRTDMRALDILGRSGPLAPTALARLLGFTTGGVTTVLDRLEKAGYIRRRPDPGDRRRQLVETTEVTAARDEEVFGDLIRATRDLLAGLHRRRALGDPRLPRPRPPAHRRPRRRPRQPRRARDQAMPRPPDTAAAGLQHRGRQPSSATAGPNLLRRP